MIRLAIATLWLAVGLAKMAALVSAIDGHWRTAVMALVAAWALAAMALGLRRLRQA